MPTYSLHTVRDWLSKKPALPTPVDSGRRPNTSLRGIVSFVCAALLTAGLALPSRANAQSENTGSITGRVLNPATGKYMENADVKIVGSNLATVTDDLGSFRF